MHSLRWATLLAILASSGCAPTLLPAAESTNTVLIATPYTESDVRSAIIRSLTRERFETESEEPGFIRARYRRGSRMIEIAVEYSGSQYRVRYLASEGFETQGLGNDQLIDSRYHKQIGKLKKYIEQELARPAREAAEAEAAAAASQHQAQSEPAVDTRNEGQVIVDILGSMGYACTAEEALWTCTPPSATWWLTVSYVREEHGGTTIWFDSYATRAFAKPCSRFTAAMNDLASTTHAFSTTCDDGTQMFRYHTAVVYGPELDVGAWVASHLEQRLRAHNLLKSIGAIRKK
jgi:hypothetical protein